MQKILMLPVGDAKVASVRYRVLAYRPALETAGFFPEVRFPMSPARWEPPRRLLRALDLARDIARPASESLLFLHRKTYPPVLATLLRRRSRPVILDIDDALDLPPPGRQLDDAARSRYRRNFEATARAADLVLCGNAELAARVPHGRVALLPTPVDTTRFAPGAAKPARAPSVGWVGHSDNLRYLEDLAPALREVARRHPRLRVIVVADRRPELAGCNVEFREWSLETEISCFDGIGIGLMPLDDDPWTRSKCAFKALQYMALGIPAVASPVGMNRDVIRDGESGFLASAPEAWIEVLDRLLRDGDLSARVGAEGRRVVERDYSLEKLSGRLVSTVRGLLASSRSRA